MRGNQFATIDFSESPALVYSLLDNNQSLQTVFIKNGSNDMVSVTDCPAMVYICADDFQVDEIQSMLDTNGVTTVACNSYCNFVPGGIYNTITGNVRLDLDNDGCDGSDIAFPSLKILLDDGINQGTMFTTNTGSYTFYVQYPDLTLTPQFENPTYFTVTPSSESVNFPAIDGSAQVRDFCVTANGIHNDIEVFIVPTVAARPGFDASYVIVYRNKGNHAISGTLNFNFDDSVLDFVSASALPDTQITDNLIWSYSNLQPFETRTIDLTLNVNSPVEIPAVNIGDELSFVATANPVAGDEMPQDNTFAFKQTVVGSFDPNDKQCLQGNVVPTTQIGDYLTYVINFENTGTFPAQNVVIKDLLDADKFDLESVQVLSASDEKVVTLSGNRLEIFFENINLVPNEYGYVAFKIKTRNDLTAGSTVTNNANIFFDFNFPVVTNTATSTFENLGIDQHPVAVAVSIFPNPASGLLNVRSDSPIDDVSITDLQGRVIKKFADGDSPLEISDIASGVYLVKIASGGRMVSRRLIVN